MSSDLAIRARGLGKVYPIFSRPSDRLRQMLLRGRRRLYREFWAVRNLDLEVRRGETVGIVGRNGSGKSTLLQLLCGTVAQSCGQLEVKGRVAALLELGAGFNPEFTGRENVYLNAAILGIDRASVEERFDTIASFADIGDYIDQPVKTYSSGMFVRLAFSVAVSVDADVLVIDEALAVGDERFQRKCFARLQEFHDAGGTILFVSHSAAMVAELCDRAILLENGEAVLTGPPGLVVKQYQRLLYAQPGHYADVLHSVRSIDSEVRAREASAGYPPGLAPRVEAPVVQQEESGAARFDPSLQPHSTIVYPESGARIRNLRVVNEDGEVVNVFPGSQRFSVVVEVEFLNALEAVYFGVHVRTVTGQVITGQRHPLPGSDIEQIQAGQVATLTFYFNVRLLPGTYFVGCGVWQEGGASCSHRIVDALVFRVLPSEASGAFGLIDARLHAPRLVVSTH